MGITLECISPFIGSGFMFQTGVGPVELILTEATELPRQGLPEQFRTPLSLIFHGPDTLVLNQDMYQIDHPELGSHQWCMVPILPSAASLGIAGSPMRPRYQVLFG